MLSLQCFIRNKYLFKRCFMAQIPLRGILSIKYLFKRYFITASQATSTEFAHRDLAVVDLPSFSIFKEEKVCKERKSRHLQRLNQHHHGQLKNP